jgi:hypothetical protein
MCNLKTFNAEMSLGIVHFSSKAKMLVIDGDNIFSKVSSYRMILAETIK